MKKKEIVKLLKASQLNKVVVLKDEEKRNVKGGDDPAPPCGSHGVNMKPNCPVNMCDVAFLNGYNPK